MSYTSVSSWFLACQERLKVSGTVKDVKDFEDAAKDLKDPDLKAFAAKTLPTLQEHLRMAQEMEAAVKSEK